MKYILILIAVLFVTPVLFSQVNVNNNSYKFQISFDKNWKEGSKVETDKKDVITYSFSKNSQVAATIIAFKFPAQQKLDDLIYTFEKDFNLNIPERIGDYVTSNTSSFESKSAEYKDKDTYEKIYYYTSIKDNNGEFYSYMIRFIAENSYKHSDFDYDVSSIINTFKVNL
ncbi:MAG: hypothetical protein WC139_13430 [Candidatus Kapaibacterium sp.]